MGGHPNRSEFSHSSPLKNHLSRVERLLEKWRPNLLVLEEVFVLKQYPKAAIQLGEVRGVIYLAAQEMDIPVIEVRPTEVKSAFTGSGRADKEQIKKDDSSNSQDRESP